MKGTIKLQSESEASMRSFSGELSGLTDKIAVGGAAIAAGSGVGETWDLGGVVDVNSLKRFLDDYRSRLMLPIELPTIVEASQRVGNGEFRELLALDQKLADAPEMKVFSEASRWIGHCHSRSMRGMKDHRVVWRYCDAIRRKEAYGWHIVVYGVVLGAYSIPLRQGIANYCGEILSSFIDSAAAKIELGVDASAQFKQEWMARIAPDVEEVVVNKSSNRLFAL